LDGTNDEYPQITDSVEICEVLSTHMAEELDRLNKYSSQLQFEDSIRDDTLIGWINYIKKDEDYVDACDSIMSASGTPSDFESALHDRISQLEGGVVSAELISGMDRDQYTYDEETIVDELWDSCQDITNLQQIYFTEDGSIMFSYGNMTDDYQAREDALLTALVDEAGFEVEIISNTGSQINMNICNLQDLIISANINVTEGPQTTDDLIALAAKHNLRHNLDEAGNLVVFDETYDPNLAGLESGFGPNINAFFDEASQNPSFHYEDYDGEFGVGLKGIQGIADIHRTDDELDLDVQSEYEDSKVDWDSIPDRDADGNFIYPVEGENYIGSGIRSPESIMAADLEQDKDYIERLAKLTVDEVAARGFQAGYQIQPDENYLYFEVFDSEDNVITEYLQLIDDINPIEEDLMNDVDQLATAIMDDIGDTVESAITASGLEYLGEDDKVVEDILDNFESITGYSLPDIEGDVYPYIRQYLYKKGIPMGRFDDILTIFDNMLIDMYGEPNEDFPEDMDMHTSSGMRQSRPIQVDPYGNAYPS
jgi:hypothetical protein